MHLGDVGLCLRLFRNPPTLVLPPQRCRWGNSFRCHPIQNLVNGQLPWPRGLEGAGPHSKVTKSFILLCQRLAQF